MVYYDTLVRGLWLNFQSRVKIIGTRTLTISSTKSGIKVNGMFYGLGGTLTILALVIYMIIKGFDIKKNPDKIIVQNKQKKKLIGTLILWTGL